MSRPGADEQPGARISIGEDQGLPALIVDGFVQSVAVRQERSGAGYWEAMLPDEHPDSALILGLGGGTIAQLLTRRFGLVPIVGVERDPEVVEVARGRLGLVLPNLNVVVEDAFAFVADCRAKFDYVCVDLYEGGQLVHGAFGKAFLAQIRLLLTPPGTAVFNLFLGRRLPKHLARLGRYFSITKTVDVEMNLVVHCHRK